MSKPVDDLIAFAERLAEDGYPTYLIEQAADRMRMLEELVVNLTNMNEKLREELGRE